VLLKPPLPKINKSFFVPGASLGHAFFQKRNCFLPALIKPIKLKPGVFLKNSAKLRVIPA